jgi:hypothetical protein
MLVGAVRNLLLRLRMGLFGRAVVFRLFHWTSLLCWLLLLLMMVLFGWTWLQLIMLLLLFSMLRVVVLRLSRSPARPVSSRTRLSRAEPGTNVAKLFYGRNL